MVSSALKKENGFVLFLKKGFPQKLPPSRIISIDAIKVLACIGVVVMHSLRNLNGDVPNHALLYCFIRVSIPLFFMVTGYFQLNRKNYSFGYSVNKILKILLVVSGWVLIYDIIQYAAYGIPLGVYNMLACYYQKGTYGVFWFFGSMILIYLMLPFLRKLFAGKRSAAYLTIALMAVCTVIHIASIIYAANHGVFLQSYVVQTCRLWTWAFYLCLGGCIKKYSLNEKIKSVKILLPSFAALTALTIGSQYYLFRVMTNVINGEYYYDSPLLTLMALNAFLLMMNIKYGKKISRIVEVFSVNLIGVYAFHIRVIKTTLMYTAVSGFWIELAFIAFVFLLSVIMSAIIRRIPYMHNLLKL